MDSLTQVSNTDGSNMGEDRKKNPERPEKLISQGHTRQSDSVKQTRSWASIASKEGGASNIGDGTSPSPVVASGSSMVASGGESVASPVVASGSSVVTSGGDCVASPVVTNSSGAVAVLSSGITSTSRRGGVASCQGKINNSIQPCNGEEHFKAQTHTITTNPQSNTN